MIIDVKYIYNVKIAQKYNIDNMDSFKSDYSEKEQSMWHFTLQLLKKNPEKASYDTEIDKNWLETFLSLFLELDEYPFTLDEWIVYMGKQ